MTKINYKSDFDFILRLKDCADPKKTVPFPDGNFDARFWTSNKANAYTASYRDGVYTNCFRTEDGGMHFVFDDHRMGKGALHWEPHFELPNGIYPDNMQDLYRKAALDIELVDGDGDCPTTAELEAMLPYIKGEPFTYEDFTAEEIKELQQPATQAAEELKEFQTEAEKKESGREAAETKRISAEELRESAEAQRASAEASRESAEDTRVSHETTRCYSEEARSNNETHRCDFEKERVAHEQARVSAEESRAQAETSRVSAEQSRATAESTRESNETTRSTNEQSRVSAEETRISNEQTRKSSEASRANAEQTRTTNEQSRQQAETARAEAEAQRASEFATWHDEIASKQGALSVSEDLSLSADNELSLTDSAKRAVFNDMFNLAAGSDGGYKPSEAPDPAKPYLLNTLWLSYEEAEREMLDYTSIITFWKRAIRRSGPNVFCIGSFDETTRTGTLNGISGLSLSEMTDILLAGNPTAAGAAYHFAFNPLIRTNLWQMWYMDGTVVGQRCFYKCANIEVACASYLRVGTDTFSHCPKLHTIIGPLYGDGNNPAPFRGCASLVNLPGLVWNGNLDISDSPLLSLASVSALIDKGKEGATITVHADVFAKLTGDTTNEAAAALTDEEKTAWAAVLTAATSKYISFAID